LIINKNFKGCWSADECMISIKMIKNI